jgi:hypothetical protein
LIPPAPVFGTNVVTRTLSGAEPIPKVLALSQLVDATAARPETRLTHNAHSWDYQLNPNDIRVAEWGDMRGTAFTVVGGTKMGWFDFRTLAAEGPGAYRAMTLAAEPDTPNGVIRAAMIGLGVTGLPAGIWGMTGPTPDFMPNTGTALAGFTGMLNTFGGTGYNWVTSKVSIRGPEGPGGVVNDEEVDVLFIHRQSSPPMLFVMIGTLDYENETT